MLKGILSRVQTRLTMAFALVALVPLALVGGYGLRATNHELRQRAVQSETQHLREIANTIQSFFRGASTDVTFLARSAPLHALLEATASGNAASIEEARQRLAQEFIALAQTRGIYFKIRYIDATGQEVVEIEGDGSAFRISDELQNEGQDDYFLHGMTLQKGEVYATRLRLETQGGVIVTPHIPGVRYAAPVFHHGERRGVVVTNVDVRPLFRRLQEQTTENRTGRQVLWVDENGYYLWHPDERKRWGGPTDLNTGESLKRDFPELAAQVLAGQPGALRSNGMVVTYTPVTLDVPGQSTWTLVELTPEEAVLAPVTRFRNLFLGLMGVALFLALLIGGVSARAIVRPLAELGHVATHISEGDLTQSVSLNGVGEIGQLAQAFRHMTAELRTLIEGIAAASKRTSSAAEALATMSEQLHTTAEQISTAVQQVTQGAGTQAHQAESISRAIAHLAQATDQIAENAEETEQASQRAQAKATHLAQTMETLQHRSADIEEMARTVKRFADQTNLLALNAAIEAARAGEHGKSFAVVADEVRRLAKSSRQAVEEITSLNAQIQAEMERVRTEVQEIMGIVHQTAALASQTSEATDRQRHEADAVVQAVNEMVSLTEEQAAGTEEMAAAVEEQMVSIGELATAAQELSDTAAELHTLVTRFQLPPAVELAKNGEVQ